MGREIKFRAWDNKEKRMLNYKEFCELYSFCESAELSFWLETKNYIVMQYTGLKDKNGKEIYESDIVKVEGVSEKWRGKNGTWSVFWHEGNAAFCFDKCYELIGLCPAVDLYGKYKYEYYEVIGNIYENPTLLSPSL